MQYAERTVPYTTYLKTALVDGLRQVFASHPDAFLNGSRPSLEKPLDQADYPTVVVRFFEREIFNNGVGHQEFIQNQRAKHFLYEGDIEFAVYALSSLDRDLMGDTLVQTIAMGELTTYTNKFFQRIDADTTQYPLAKYNFITLNKDKVRGFGEVEAKAPWQAEDQLVYQKSYRAAVFGEFYSLIFSPPGIAFIEHVIQYPYTDGDPIPQGNPADPAPWQP